MSEIRKIGVDVVITPERVAEIKDFFQNTVFYKNLDNYLKNLTIKVKDRTRLLAKIDINLFSSLVKTMALHLTEGNYEDAVLEEGAIALQSFTGWVASQTTKLDTRSYNEDDKLVRRMNALARLIKPKNSDSACTAVTLVNGVLYVSMNNTGCKVDFNTLFETIRQRLKFLRECPPVKNSTVAYDEFFKKHAAELVAEHFHQDLPLNVLAQDLAKLINSLHLEPDNCPELQPLLSDTLPIVFLYPESALQYRVVNGTTMESNSFDVIHPSLNLDEKRKLARKLNKNDIHAEQILVDYLFERNPKPEQIVSLGVSKLCCATCMEFMKHYEQVKVQGTHGTTYDHTYNMKTGKLSSWDGILNPRHICPQQSPGDSPVRSPVKPARASMVDFPKTLFSHSKHLKAKLQSLEIRDDSMTSIGLRNFDR